MNTPSPAPAPDPVATAKAQGAANRDTAVTQYGLNATNQVTPGGSLTYNQIGKWEDGTPRFEATTALNPNEQKIFNTGEQTKQNLADIGSTQSAKIGGLLNTPFSVGDATNSKIAQIQKGFLDPEWDRRSQQLESSLTNRGIRPGSEQYSLMQRDFGDQRSRAYDQSYLDAYGKAQQAALTERNQPINEISALMSGSQVSQPNFTNTPMPGVAPTDVIGAQEQSLRQGNVGFNAALQQNMGLMNGLFGLGGAGIKAAGAYYGG